MPKDELRWGAHLPYVSLELQGPRINHKVWHMASALLELQSPSQSQSITGTKLYCLVTEAHRC